MTYMLTVQFGYFSQLESENRNQTKNFQCSNHQNQNQTKKPK